MNNNAILLTEDFNVGKDFEVLKEAQSVKDLVVGKNGLKGILKLGGIFQEAEEINRNNRIYGRRILEGALLRDLVPLIGERSLLGELDHNDDLPEMTRVSHAITDLKMDGVLVEGELVIFPTTFGRDAAVIYKAGVQPHISARGLGNVVERADGVQIVQEDYKMITYDLVSIGSHRRAKPTILEKALAQVTTQKGLDTLGVVSHLLNGNFDKAIKEDRNLTMKLGDYVEFLNSVVELSGTIEDIKKKYK